MPGRPAQVLLAVIASMYAVYHGPEGLTRIARRIASYTAILADGLGNWILNVREYGPACTAQLEDLRRGTGGGTFSFLTCTAPMAVSAPGRFSTTTGCPQSSLIFCATTRERMSVGPPAEKGTTSATGRSG